MLDTYRCSPSNLKVTPNLFNQLASDNFGYANGELNSVSSGRWVKVGSGSASDSGSTVISTSASSCIYKDTSGSVSTQRFQYAQATLNAAGTDMVGLALRVQATAESGYVLEYDEAATTLRVKSVSAGTYTTLRSFTRNYPSGTQLRFSVCGITGSTRLYVEENTGTGWQYVIKTLDPGTYFYSGWPGMYFKGSAGTSSLSVWSCGQFYGISPNFVGELARISGNAAGSSTIAYTLTQPIDAGDIVVVAFVFEAGFVIASVADSSSNTWTVLQTVTDTLNSTSIAYAVVATKLNVGDSITLTLDGGAYAAYAASFSRFEGCNLCYDSNQSSDYNVNVPNMPAQMTAQSSAIAVINVLSTSVNYSGTGLFYSGAPMVWGTSQNKKAYILTYPSNNAFEVNPLGSFSAAVGQLNVIASFSSY